MGMEGEGLIFVVYSDAIATMPGIFFIYFFLIFHYSKGNPEENFFFGFCETTRINTNKTKNIIVSYSLEKKSTSNNCPFLL